MRIQEKLNPFAGVLLVLTGAVLFSGKAVLVKIGLAEGASVMTLLNLRMLMALPFFIVMAYRSEKKAQTRIESKDWMAVVFLGITGYYLASLFDFQGLKYISAGIERLILFIYPTLVVIISSVIFKTGITRKQAVALFITYSGILLAFAGEKIGGTDIMKGAFLIFLSALTYAIYLIGSGRMIPRLGATRFTAYGMIVSTIAVVGHSLVTREFFLATTPHVYVICLVMAIFCTVLPSFILAEGIRKIGSGTASIVGSIGPVSTIVLAALFLNETISLHQLAGTLIVIGGVIFIGKEKNSPQPVLQK